MAAFQRDLALFNDLKQLLRRLPPLLDKLDDTALAVYGYAKAAGKGLGLHTAAPVPITTHPV